MLTESYQNKTAELKRKEAWVQAGTAVNATSAAEAASQAGLDWTVSLHDMAAYYPVSTATDMGVITLNHMIDVPKRKAVVKTTPTGETTSIGVVSDSYKVIQNQEIFSALDNLIDTNELRYTAAGELNGGANVWMLMALPMSVNVANDPHKGFLIATTGHNGSQSFTLRPLVQRMYCTNQINISMFNGVAARRQKAFTYRLKHTKNAKLNLSEVREIIQLCYDGIETYENGSKYLLEKEVARTAAQAFFERVFPISKEIADTDPKLWTPQQRNSYNRTIDNRATAASIYFHSETQENIRNTGFGLFQSIVEFADHYGRANADKRAIAALSGRSDVLKRKAFDLALGLALAV